MFDNEVETKKMLEGAYRKLKHYYYYNKNFLAMREKIVEFENRNQSIDQQLYQISSSLVHFKKKSSKEFFNNLVSQINFFSLPKKFESKTSSSNSNLISNTISKDKTLKTINLFIDMPIELHLIDVLWTLFLAKIAYDNELISSNVYGNLVLNQVVNDSEKQPYVNIESSKLFYMYFYQYTKWRNCAFSSLENNYDYGKDSVLISVDIKSYFYTASLDFTKITDLFGNHSLWDSIQPLTFISEKVYTTYKNIICNYRKDIDKTNDSTPLPIGLFSSMVIANVYLSGFDKNVLSVKGLSYYGRYVDDMLFVVRMSVEKEDKNEDVIKKALVNNNLLKEQTNGYSLIGYDNLNIQKEKIKVIYINHTESRALIDIYNNSIKIYPSQTDPIPDYDIELSSFDEAAYSIENFSKENKIRDIGHIGIDQYKVSMYFSSLIQKYSHIDSFDNKSGTINKNIDLTISQIEKFFTGSQCLEFYSAWQNYAYFLVITQRHSNLTYFYNKVLGTISNLTCESIDNGILKKSNICDRTKDYLKKHLDICRYSALALDLEMVKNKFSPLRGEVNKYIKSNMFNHKLIAFPLANYMLFNTDISLLKMDIKNFGDSKGIDKERLDWTPRFIHLDELLLLSFYNYHIKNQNGNTLEGFNEKYIDKIINRFISINHIKPSESYSEMISATQHNFNSLSKSTPQYNIRKVRIQNGATMYPPKINIAVANIKLEKSTVGTIHRWENMSFSYKKTITSILKEAFDYCKENTKLLVFPELSLPVYWISEIIQFSKKSQIGIVTGLQYWGDDNGRVYNSIATILPFESNDGKYKNACVLIREKNDYSPIEKRELKENGRFCTDRKIADYQIFEWKGICLTPVLCFELTDIFARSLLKGNCDVIAAAVYNPDTTYFSNIIDSTARDLHAFIAQANTSVYGDSRITGPYDRDSKDIFKIKGGDNDHTIVGTIDFKRYVEYQINYYSNIESDQNTKSNSKPNIKPLSARFSNKRTTDEF